MRILVALLMMTAVARADSECASPSTCRPACDKGDASACAWLGSYYLDAIELDNEVYRAIAIKLLDAACTKGSSDACARLPHAYVRDIKHEPPASKMSELRDKACKLGDAESCADPKARLALHEKQCEAGRPSACRSAARAYGFKPKRSADDPPPPEDDDSGGTGTAMALDEGKMGQKDARQQAIDQARAAGIVGDEPPPGVKPDAKKAQALAARADKLVADACAHNRARTCADGGDDAKSRERACNAGATERCYELARHAMFDNKPWEAYAKRECELGDFVGCLFLADASEKKDPTLAAAYSQKACDAHDPEACALLGRKAPKDKATALYQRACDDGEPYGCEQLGDADPKRALELYERACTLEYDTLALVRPICSELAAKIEAKDAAKAKALRKQGCDHGEKKACKSP